MLAAVRGYDMMLVAKGASPNTLRQKYYNEYLLCHPTFKGVLSGKIPSKLLDNIAIPDDTFNISQEYNDYGADVPIVDDWKETYIGGRLERKDDEFYVLKYIVEYSHVGSGFGESTCSVRTEEEPLLNFDLLISNGADLRELCDRFGDSLIFGAF